MSNPSRGNLLSLKSRTLLHSSTSHSCIPSCVRSHAREPQVQETLTLKASQLGRAWDAERVRKALWSSAMRFRFTLFAGEDAPATKSNSTTVGRRGSASSKTTSKAVEPKTSSTKITKPVAEEAAPTTSEKQGAVAVSDKSRKRKGSAKGTGDTTGRGSRKSGDERKSAEASGTGVTEERRKSRRS